MLKKLVSVYSNAFEEISKAESLYFYDEKYLNRLTKKAVNDYKKNKLIEANSIDEALKKFSKRK